jgi:hypothetical protein
MEYGSHLASAKAATTRDTSAKNRRRSRHKMRTLAYVNVDSVNGGILRDVSEHGIAIQSLAPVSASQQVHLRLELPNPKLRLDAVARIVWTDALGQAGVEFLELPQRPRRLLKDWIFTQLLAAAERDSVESVYSLHSSSEAADLQFSKSSRPSISLRQPDRQNNRRQDSSSPRVESHDPRRLRLLGCSLPLSVRGFSSLVDGLVLLCAVLLFTVAALAVTDVLPSWPFTVAFVSGVTAVFTGLYWLLFAVWFGTTPGKHLAQLARFEADEEMRSEQARTRFR